MFTSLKQYHVIHTIHTRTLFQLFQKILTEIDKKIEDLKEKLYTRMKTMPINVQEQTKYIRQGIIILYLHHSFLLSIFKFVFHYIFTVMFASY